MLTKLSPLLLERTRCAYVLLGMPSFRWWPAQPLAPLTGAYAWVPASTTFPSSRRLAARLDRQGDADRGCNDCDAVVDNVDEAVCRVCKLPRRENDGFILNSSAYKRTRGAELEERLSPLATSRLGSPAEKQELKISRTHQTCRSGTVSLWVDKDMYSRTG